MTFAPPADAPELEPEPVAVPDPEVVLVLGATVPVPVLADVEVLLDDAGAAVVVPELGLHSEVGVDELVPAELEDAGSLAGADVLAVLSVDADPSAAPVVVAGGQVAVTGASAVPVLVDTTGCPPEAVSGLRL